MTNLNDKGFSLIAGLLITVVIVAIGGAGWHVWNKTQDRTPEMVVNENADLSNEAEVALTLPNPMKYIASYTLPYGWKDKDCKDYVIAIIPTATDDPDCDLDQPNKIASLATLDLASSEINPESCHETLANIREIGVTSVTIDDCSEVTVDGRKGVKLLQTTSKDNFVGDSKQVTYGIKVDSDFYIYANYIYRYKEAGATDFTETFSTFVDSIVFK